MNPFSSLKFREATVEDIAQIQVVRQSVKENILSRPDLVTNEDCLEYLSKRGKGWVCEDSEKILGFAIADLQEDNIWALFVRPEHENRGIGTKLHELMLNWYFSQGKDKVRLGTAPGTRAEKFYRKMGWRETGRHGKDELKFELTREEWTGKRLYSFMSGVVNKSTGIVTELSKYSWSQVQFDEVFLSIYSDDLKESRRAADLIENITRNKPGLLRKHKVKVLELFFSATDKQVKWHIIPLVSRVKLNLDELGPVWERLSNNAVKLSEGKVIRVNSLQALWEISRDYPELETDYELSLEMLSQDPAPSIQARIRNLQKRSLKKKI